MHKPSLGFKIGPHHKYLGRFAGKGFLEAGHNLQLIGEPPTDDAARQGIVPVPGPTPISYGGDVMKPPVAIDASPAAVPSPTPGLPEARQTLRTARRAGRQAVRQARRTGRRAVRGAAGTGDVQATINAMAARRSAIQGARSGARDAMMAAQLDRVLARGRTRQARGLPGRTLRQARRTARRTTSFVMP